MNIREHPAVVSRQDILMVDPRKIKIQNDWNPRIDFSNQEDMERDVAQNGIKQPILLKLTKSEEFVLIDGERRLRAALHAIDQGVAIKAIPAKVAPRNISDSNALIEAIVRNHTKPFMPLEEANAYHRLFKWGHTISDIAKNMGKTETHVNKRLSLLEGCEELKEALNEKKIPEYLARNIIEESDGSIERQKELVKEASKSKEGKKKVQKLVDKTLNVSQLGNAKYWDEEDLLYTKIDEAKNNVTAFLDTQKSSEKSEDLQEAEKLLEKVLKALDVRVVKFKK